MSKKTGDSARSAPVFEIDPMECPFREFKDNELQSEFWGLGPAAFRAALFNVKSGAKSQAEHVWVDDQTQPLPRSVRQYLHSWVRAEDLALNRWDAETVVFEENNGGKMSVMDIQLSHAQVLQRSSFCRQVLSSCYILERVDPFLVEHQWENFTFSFGSEGWRPRYHIYSQGMKSGGGQQHRPGLSKNGCYLVRLFCLGAWRCVWVSDQVPVDAAGSPLLPFSPLLSNVPAFKPAAAKQPVATVTAPVVHLWPLLICKALLKLAAPDMNSDEDLYEAEDEEMSEFNIMHSLTGSMSLTYQFSDLEDLWKQITAEVAMFGWDDDDDTVASTIKSKSTKKPTTKDASVVRKNSIVSARIKDSKNHAPFFLPGLTPAHEMDLLVTMARDLPLKKPLPEPEVALWKHYRWIDWARSHGLYDAYACPRTRFLKVNGLLKMSHAPYLLDVQSTDSITAAFREENDKPGVAPKKGMKEVNRSITTNLGVSVTKEELREWIPFDTIKTLIKTINILYYPSMYEFTSAGSNPPLRITKTAPNKAIDILAPKYAPMYLQIDGPDDITLRISISALHPRILSNSGTPMVDYIDPSYLILETLKWFVDAEVPVCKAFIRTRGYESIEVTFEPGRHICRLWIHSVTNWHIMLLSESALLLGARDLVQSAAVKECPWASRFLSHLGTSFINWTKVNRSSTHVVESDREFFKSYQPDLKWDTKIIGYNKALLHWMFRQALKSLLAKRLPSVDFQNVCIVLRKYLCDPDFGLPEKTPPPSKTLREIATVDPCDCVIPEAEALEEEILEEEEEQVQEEKPLVDEATMTQLLSAPVDPINSHVCELATEDIPCGILKVEREKFIKRHEAATLLQAYWRGTRVRKCLRSPVVFTPDVLKALIDNAFGNYEVLSALMNEFFEMFPSTKPAYSLASALTGTYGLRQYTGTAPVTPKCTWIPYFQGTFFCHEPLKVHFDIQSSICSTVAVYDNDTGLQMPQVYNAHITFDFKPNVFGYTVMGHASLTQPTGLHSEVFWQLTVLSSINGSFHICDNDLDGCKEIPLQHCYKLHIDEIFIPNRRNILGGIQISVLKNEAVSFRAAATSADLEIEVILRTAQGNEMQEISKCCGKGEVYWPYVRLEPKMMRSSISQSNLLSSTREGHISSRSLKAPKTNKAPVGAKNKSATKFKPLEPDPKLYFIEVTAPRGWPLTLAQWQRVDEIRNSNEFIKIDSPQSRKAAKEKPTSAKDKDKDKHQSSPARQPQPDDAYIVIECGLTIGGGVFAKRDDNRDLELAAAIKSWDVKEPGRNLRGAQIRKDFRAEFLEAVPLSVSESMNTVVEECLEEFSDEDIKESTKQLPQGPTPVSESVFMEMSVETAEEAKYLTMPEILRDKFTPLYFVPLCTKEKDEHICVVVSPDMAEAAKKDRDARIETALERTRDLQLYNETFVLGRQRKRCQMLEKLFIDSTWNEELTRILEERDNAIAQETLNRTLSATKKKQETKKK